MCEATVYFSNDKEGNPIMKDVVLVQPEGDAYLLVSLLGEQKLVQGSIEKIDFLKHTVHMSHIQETTTED